MVLIQPDMVRAWELLSWAMCQRVPLCLTHSGLSGIKLPHNAILHSEKTQDLLISPPPVAACFLLPAVIALLVWSHKQAETQDGWTKVSQYSIHTIPTPVKQQPWLAAICRRSHLQAQPSTQKSPRYNSHFRDLRHVRRAHVLLHPLGLQHTVAGCKPHP